MAVAFGWPVAGGLPDYRINGLMRIDDHSPGHTVSLHILRSYETPEHSKFGLEGEILKHSRVRRCTPEPHVAEQPDHSDHGPNNPFTIYQEDKIDLFDT